MKAQEEIVGRIKERKESDLLGFETDEYYPYLDYEHAKEFLKPTVTEKKWMEDTKDTKSPAEKIREYMPLAWAKANGCRGISASRSIEHMIAWMWLDGKDWLEDEYDQNYCYYGKPQLVKVCEEYGIDWKALDDGCWRNSESGGHISAEEALSC